MDNKRERNANEKQYELTGSTKAAVSNLLTSNMKKNKILDCMTYWPQQNPTFI
jgi:hypothetical protein